MLWKSCQNFSQILAKLAPPIAREGAFFSVFRDLHDFRIKTIMERLCCWQSSWLRSSLCRAPILPHAQDLRGCSEQVISRERLHEEHLLLTLQHILCIRNSPEMRKGGTGSVVLGVLAFRFLEKHSPWRNMQAHCLNNFMSNYGKHIEIIILSGRD